MGGNTGLIACTADCHGDWGGVAEEDNCGVCSKGASGHVFDSDKDLCGVCFVDDSSCADCNGDPLGDATLDSCNEYSGGNSEHVADSDDL